jgi:hypothetical protein
MRTTLYLKQTDLAIQLAAVALPTIEAIYYTDISCMMTAYVALGLAQVISCIINGFALPGEYKHTTRIAYQYVLASIAMLIFAVVAGKSDDQRAFIFYALMVASPFLATWYLWFSYKEVKFLKALVMRPQFTRI